MSHAQNSIKKYFQATRSSPTPFHPQMALISLNPGQENACHNMNYVGFGNGGMNMLAQQIRNGPYIEPQNFNAWNGNVGELIEYNNTKNANVNYVQDDMNSFGNDFTNSRNFNCTNNYSGEMSNSGNNNPRMMTHPYYNKQKFNTIRPKNFMQENDGFRGQFSNNISGFPLMNPEEKSTKNYRKLPVIDENKILQNYSSSALKVEGIKTQEKPITVAESPRAGVITTFAKNQKSQEKPKNLLGTGMRGFTGSVDKSMKWYSIVQEIGVDYIIEVIARCVNVKPGNGCEKHILLRDSSGPVLQVIFYEIDFLLPEITTGMTVRVVGKMIGKNRMKAFKIRQVLPFEEAALPRLCAISHHMFNKLHASFTASNAKDEKNN